MLDYHTVATMALSASNIVSLKNIGNIRLWPVESRECQDRAPCADQPRSLKTKIWSHGRSYVTCLPHARHSTTISIDIPLLYLQHIHSTTVTIYSN